MILKSITSKYSVLAILTLWLWLLVLLLIGLTENLLTFLDFHFSIYFFITLSKFGISHLTSRSNVWWMFVLKWALMPLKCTLEQRFSTAGSRPDNGSWQILNGSQPSVRFKKNPKTQTFFFAELRKHCKQKYFFV